MSTRTLDGHDVAYAAKRLGISQSKVWRLVDTGDLPFVNVGEHRRRSIRFLDEDLDAWIARRRVDRRPAQPERAPAAVVEDAMRDAAGTTLMRTGRFS